MRSDDDGFFSPQDDVSRLNVCRTHQVTREEKEEENPDDVYRHSALKKIFILATDSFRIFDHHPGWLAIDLVTTPILFLVFFATVDHAAAPQAFFVRFYSAQLTVFHVIPTVPRGEPY